jgi:curved DNA-binding protein CbpA
MTPEETLYDILGVEVDATTQQIVDAYRRLARRVHPDVGGTASLFRQVETAHAVLTDPARRAAYDQPVRSARSSDDVTRDASARGFERRADPRADPLRADRRADRRADPASQPPAESSGQPPAEPSAEPSADPSAGRSGGPSTRTSSPGGFPPSPPGQKEADAPPGVVAWPTLPDRAFVLDVLRRWARTKRLVGNDTFDDIVSVEDATLWEVEIDRLVETRWEEQGVTPGQGVQFPLYRNLYHVTVPPPTTVRAEHTWSLAKEGSLVVRECRHRGRGPGGRDSCPDCATTGYVTEFRSGKIERKIVRSSLARANGLDGVVVGAGDWRSFGPFSGVRPPSGISIDLHRDLGYELSKHPPGELLRDLRGRLMPATAVTYRKKRGDGLALLLGDDNEVRLTSAPHASARS